MVHYHRSIGVNAEVSVKIVQMLNKMGIVTVVDLDDYWLPTKEHPAYNLVIQNELHRKIIDNLKVAQYVTTTTSIFSDEIKKYNKNIFILPNAINPKEPQFMAETKPSDKLRFGWLGGSSHLHDLKLLEGTFSKLSQVKDKYRLYLCGFDIRGIITEINSKTKEQKQRPIKPHETVWSQYEKIFTDDFKLTTPEHKEFLYLPCWA